MPKIKVLIVDDSSVARMVLADYLSTDDEIEIVGMASNGKEAIEKVKKLKPSLVTLDINMPVMNGLDTIEHLMAYSPVPVLVVTSRGDADTAYSAIAKGALDVIPKPDIDAENVEDLTRKVKLLAGVKVITHIGGFAANADKTKKIVGIQNKSPEDKKTEKAIVIASSTGGPKALFKIFSELPKNLPLPVFVAQHIPSDFLPGFVEWLNGITELKVKAGERGEAVLPGTIYISPVDKTMVIGKDGRLNLVTNSSDCIYSPSCNLLLTSAAEVYKENCMGIILTGMGNDGVLGMDEIRRNGGRTIAQDEATSIVFGMPREAIESGCVDKIIALDKISREMLRF